VHVEPLLPLPRMLPYADLFVTHGGFNSIKEAAAATAQPSSPRRWPRYPRSTAPSTSSKPSPDER
jgi:hypothetical protein